MGGDLQAAVLAYVRTEEDGVVELQPGDPVPDGALEGDIERLVASGALVDAAERDTTVKGILGEVGDDPNRAAAALDLEKAGENRPTLVSQLEKIVARSGDSGES